MEHTMYDVCLSPLCRASYQQAVLLHLQASRELIPHPLTEMSQLSSVDPLRLPINSLGHSLTESSLVTSNL